MTQWSTHKVSEWARQAGWRGADVTEAVALAMAASNGADHATTNPSYKPELERRGLWQLTTAEAEAWDFGDLYDPLINAIAAKARWDRAGGSWLWHPVQWSGAMDNARDLVRATLGRRARGGSYAVGMDFHRRLADATSFAAQLQVSVPNVE